MLYRKIPLSLFLFAGSFLITPELMSQFKTPTIIYDTVFGVWEEAAPGTIRQYASILTDAKGNMYTVMDDIGKEQVSVLSDGKWKNIHQGLPADSLRYLTSNISGDIYAVFRNGKEMTYYKLVNGTWEFAVKHNYWILFGNDGNYYARKDNENGSSNILKWENGTWSAVGPAGNPLTVLKYPRFVVDENGVLYFGYEKEKGNNPVMMWDGKTLTEIGRMPEFSQLISDKQGNLYTTTHYSKNWFFKKWNGIEWTDMILPADISDPTKYTPRINEQLGTIYLKGHNEKNPSKDSDLFYKYDNGKWTLLQTYIWNDLIVEPFEANNKVYAVPRRGRSLSNKTIKVFRQETYPFVFEQGVTDNGGIKWRLDELRLVKQNGKFGITNNKGETLIYPSFDKISIGQVTSKETNDKSVYTFHVTTGGESYDCGINYYDAGQQYLYSPGKSGEYKCENCKGAGIFPKIEKVLVKGKKIPESTTSTTTNKTSYETKWDPKTNTYKGTTTTTPVTTTKTVGGGYEPDHYEEKLVNEKCSVCRGAGRKFHPAILVYDQAINAYRKLRN